MARWIRSDDLEAMCAAIDAKFREDPQGATRRASADSNPVSSSVKPVSGGILFTFSALARNILNCDCNFPSLLLKAPQ